jgi:hypothetical protein
MFRIVSELRPAWVIGENVAGFRTMGLDQALTDLESAGYACRAFNIPAVAVGADHERKRIFIVANSLHNGLNGDKESGSVIERGCRSEEREDGTRQPQRSSSSSGGIKVVAYTDSARDRALRYRALRERKETNEGQTGLSQFELGGQRAVMADPRRPGLEGSEQHGSHPIESGRGEVVTRGTTPQRGIMPDRGAWLTEPGVGGTINGFSTWLDRFGIGSINISYERLMTYRDTHANTEEDRPDKILRTLWDVIKEENLQRAVGGTREFPAEKILLAYLCKLKETSETLDNISFASSEAQKVKLRGMQHPIQPTSTPHRPQYKEQQRGEYTNPMQTLSRLLAYDCKEAWSRYIGENASIILNPWRRGWDNGIPHVAPRVPLRMDRLKCLGNAVVPQQVYPIVKAIYDIEMMRHERH